MIQKGGGYIASKQQECNSTEILQWQCELDRATFQQVSQSRVDVTLPIFTCTRISTEIPYSLNFRFRHTTPIVTMTCLSVHMSSKEHAGVRAFPGCHSQTGILAGRWLRKGPRVNAKHELEDACYEGYCLLWKLQPNDVSLSLGSGGG